MLDANMYCPETLMSSTITLIGMYFPIGIPGPTTIPPACLFRPNARNRLARFPSHHF